MLDSGASAGSHSIGNRIKDSMTQADIAAARKAAELAGFSFSQIWDNRMKGIADLNADRLRTLQETAPTFWAKLNEEVKGHLEAIIATGDELEEIEKGMRETLTGVSFDSFYDSFVSTLTDMSKSSKDFTDSFGEMLKNAILQNLIANKYRGKIEKLYEDWLPHQTATTTECSTSTRQKPPASGRRKSSRPTPC